MDHGIAVRPLVLAVFLTHVEHVHPQAPHAVQIVLGDLLSTRLLANCVQDFLSRHDVRRHQLAGPPVECRRSFVELPSSSDKANAGTWSAFTERRRGTTLADGVGRGGGDSSLTHT